ncbi:hypothetical protein AC579_1403 [Pseudocercospora musae]|uniref:Plus3 domain-containing protein n=1 Tax=Pseudocercospora musae TaxID=113226 RepID=A0A139IG40_9PEZI|nr:hypothetical protein AC579_1403 [Pseudocercospora musae]
MADDLDNELLGLVSDGEESEDSGDDFGRLEADVEGRSPSAEPHQSVEKTEELPERRKGVAQKVKARRGKRKARQESEDEDDAASPSPPPDHIDALGESDHDADAPGEEDEEAALFPFEGQFYDAADKAKVMDMPELDREEILAERAQQLTKRMQDLQLKKALANSSAAASKAKRKAAAAELDEDKNRRSTRPRVEKRSALDDYKRAREQKGAERDRLASTRDRRDSRSPSFRGSDRDADGDSEVEWAAEPERKDEPPAELRDFDRCRMGRSAFAKVCFYPEFEKLVTGCFARVSIGLNRETGQNMYRMTQIKGFTVGKPYQLESSAGKPFITDQYAVVTQGAAEKPWPFSACSDSKLTEVEFTRFKDTLNKENMRMPSKRFLGKKLDDINQLLQTKFTEQSLQEKFAKQRAIQLKYDPVHQAREKRKNIERRRAEAEEAQDEEEVARCDAELEALDNGSANGISAVKAKASPVKPVDQHHKLALLNQTNRKKTQNEVRQALITERKKQLKAREVEQAKKTAEAKAKIEAKAAERRKSNLELFGEDTPGTSRAGTPMNGADTPKRRAGTPLVGSKEKGPVGALKKKNMDDDVIGSMDLGIEIDI